MEIIKDFFQPNEEIVGNNDIHPKLIWNTDETQLGGSNDRKKVASRKGEGRPCKGQMKRKNMSL
jgi:hypothetical protein